MPACQQMKFATFSRLCIFSSEQMYGSLKDCIDELVLCRIFHDGHDCELRSSEDACVCK